MGEQREPQVEGGESDGPLTANPNNISSPPVIAGDKNPKN